MVMDDSVQVGTIEERIIENAMKKGPLILRIPSRSIKPPLMRLMKWPVLYREFTP